MHDSAQATKAPHRVEIPEIEVALTATSVPLGSGGAVPGATRAGIMVYGNAIVGSNPAQPRPRDQGTAHPRPTSSL